MTASRSPASTTRTPGPREIVVPALAEEKARRILAELEANGNTVLPGDVPGEAPDFPT